VAQLAAPHAIPDRARDERGPAPSALPDAPPVSRRERLCTASLVKGLVVRLRHADGSPLCNGMVSIEEGAYREELSCYLDQCSGAGERAGTYTVRAKGSGLLAEDDARDRRRARSGRLPRRPSIHDDGTVAKSRGGAYIYELSAAPLRSNRD
jgi:hypothetical protein